MPEHWDEDDDGVWKPPTIPNPEHKGQWRRKKIKNPNYKGKWRTPYIDNPEFEDDPGLYVMKPIKYVGIEVWQTGRLRAGRFSTMSWKTCRGRRICKQRVRDAEKDSFEEAEKIRRAREESRRAREEGERRKRERDDGRRNRKDRYREKYRKYAGLSSQQNQRNCNL